MLVITDASLEDIFIVKLIANLPGDAKDCAALFSAVLDFDAVYREIEVQYRKAGEVEQKIWITYIEEGIGRLEEVHNLEIPIGDKVSKLADKRAGGAGVRPIAPDHQEARQHACGCPGAAAEKSGDRNPASFSFQPQTTNIYNDYLDSLPLHAKSGGRVVGKTRFR